jgi:hypothetical protein
LLVIPDPMAARAGAIATLRLVLWLTEVVPPFAPALLLLATECCDGRCRRAST